MSKYVLGIDQSTQGTKAILFDQNGRLTARSDRPHKQIVNDNQWISHDLDEIYQALIGAVGEVVRISTIDPSDIVCAGLTNQRETSAIWDTDGTPLSLAVVWQCRRAEEITRKLEEAGLSAAIYERSGLQLSPYFSAAKLSWLLQNTKGVQDLLEQGRVRLGTMDTFLLYRLSKGACYATDYSNASRTQLMNIRDLEWDDDLCSCFEIPVSVLPEIRNSDDLYCHTDFEGVLPEPIPVHAVLGDSHAAFYGQHCKDEGSCKVTFGTGSSIMLNTGNEVVDSPKRLSRSVGWKDSRGLHYVMEGNINYTGAIVTWMIKDVGLINDVSEADRLPYEANPEDETILVPAFSGLGAPYWNTDVKAAFLKMSRQTGKAELVRAGIDSISYQIQDVLHIMRKETAYPISRIRVDGGPTNNRYLMHKVSEVSEVDIEKPSISELSAMGTAFMAGQASGLYSEDVFGTVRYQVFQSEENDNMARKRYLSWKTAMQNFCELDL